MPTLWDRVRALSRNAAREKLNKNDFKEMAMRKKLEDDNVEGRAESQHHTVTVIPSESKHDYTFPPSSLTHFYLV